MRRRTFLAASATIAGSTLALSGCGAGLIAPREAIGQDIQLTSLRRLKVVRIDALSGRCEYVADTGRQAISRPIFHARTGDFCDFVIDNLLPQPTTVHFHGLSLPESQDGAGFDPILPGASKRVQFQIRNRAGLYWLHSHAHGFTAEQVHAGLIALLIVHDTEDDTLSSALSLDADAQIAVALSDVRLSNGVFSPYAPIGDECLHGWYGNRMLANGVIDASYKVSPGWVRLRLLNGCNARGLQIGFRNATTGIADSTAESRGDLRPFYLLGTDGGLLPSARRLNRLFLHSAERVDLAIPMSPEEAIEAVSVAFDPRHQVSSKWPGHLHPARHGYAPLSAGAICSNTEAAGASLPDGASLRLFLLRAAGGVRGKPAALPDKLSVLEAVSEVRREPDRRLRLEFDDKTGFLIDNLAYRAEEAGIAVRRGAKQVWEIRNSPISMPHPMHLHGFQFRVLRRQGTFGSARAMAVESGGRLPTDLGLKDTVTLWPNETLWIEVDFSLPQDASFQGEQRYMFHCHNLEHEDGMMMRNVVVI